MRFYYFSDGLIWLYVAACCLIKAHRDGFKTQRYCSMHGALWYGEPQCVHIPNCHLALASIAYGVGICL